MIDSASPNARQATIDAPAAVDAPPPPARRDEILAVARDLFFERGFATASMRDMAAGIGLTQAAIYYHFRSKEEILLALIEGFTELLHSTLQRALHQTGDPVADLRHAVRTHMLLSRTHYREIKLVTEDKRLLGPGFAERVRQRESTIYALYRDRVAELMRDGRCRKLAASVVVFNMLAMINFVFQWYRPGGPLSLEEVADQTVTLLMQGLLAEAPAAPARRIERAARGSIPNRGDKR